MASVIQDDDSYSQMSEANSHTVAACQIGADRSRDYKLLMDALGIPVVMSEQDMGKLKAAGSAGRSAARIGMAYANLGSMISRGTPDPEGVVPAGFDRPIRTIVGFTDAGNELKDVNDLCEGILKYCEKQGFDEFPIDLVIVQGKGPNVDKKIDIIREIAQIDRNFMRRSSPRD
jgi:hypothetical protein